MIYYKCLLHYINSKVSEPWGGMEPKFQVLELWALFHRLIGAENDDSTGIIFNRLTANFTLFFLFPYV